MTIPRQWNRYVYNNEIISVNPYTELWTMNRYFTAPASHDSVQLGRGRVKSHPLPSSHTPLHTSSSNSTSYLAAAIIVFLSFQIFARSSRGKFGRIDAPPPGLSPLPRSRMITQIWLLYPSGPSALLSLLLSFILDFCCIMISSSDLQHAFSRTASPCVLCNNLLYSGTDFGMTLTSRKNNNRGDKEVQSTCAECSYLGCRCAD